MGDRSRSRSPSPKPQDTQAKLLGKEVDPKRVCSYWGTPGGCRKGATCDFLHLSSCEEFGRAGQCSRGSDCDKLHVIKKKEICRYWLTPQGCFKGVTCDFQHPPHLMGAGPAAASATFSASVSASAFPYGNYPPYGGVQAPPYPLLPPAVAPSPSASFHPLDVRSSPATPVDPRKLCNYFNTPQGCRRGMACPFVHLAANAPPPAAPYPPSWPSAASPSVASSSFHSPSHRRHRSRSRSPRSEPVSSQNYMSYYGRS